MDDIQVALDTPGYRVYLIRKALGTDPRKPLAGRAFADLLNAKAEELGLDVRYNSSAITRIEKGERVLTIDDAKIIAAVDPLHRGPMWLADFGEEPPEAGSAGATSGPTPPLAPPGPQDVRAKTPRERGKAARKRRQA